MGIKIYSTILVVLFSAVSCFAQDYEWAKTILEPNNRNFSRSKLATNGNDKFLVGDFSSFMEIGFQTLTTNRDMAIYLAKYNALDSLVWAKKIIEGKTTIGGANVYASALTPIFDNLGNIYLIIGSNDTVYINNITYPTNFINPTYGNSFVLKLDSSGNLLETFSLEGSCFKVIRNIHIDEYQNMYVYGEFGNDNWGTTNNCTCIFDSIIYTTNEAELFLAKYNTNGNLIWINTFGDNTYLHSNNFKIIDDAIYISGGALYTSITINFGPYTLSFPSNYDNGAFIAKYDTSGVFQWAKYYGVKGWDSYVINNDMDIVSNNTIVVGGVVQTQSESSHLYFQNSSALTRYSAGSEENYFVICYDSLGNIKWKDMAYGGSYDKLSGFASDKNKNLYITGNFSDKLYFANDSIEHYAWNADVFVAAYDSIGNQQWIKRAGGTGGDYGIDIATTTNDIYVTGSTTSYPVHFDTAYSIAPQNSAKMFLAKLTPSTISSTTAIPLANTNKQLIKIVDVLGRETKAVKGRLLFYIYSDGSVDKRILLN